MPFIRTQDHLTIVFPDGYTTIVYPSNGQYKNIVEALNQKDYDRARVLSTPAKVIEEQLSRGEDGSDDATCEIVDGEVIYDGKPLHNTLTQRILAMLDEGFDVEPMKKFLVNLYQNPSFRSVNELYRFLEKGNLPITEDGHFLAYKKVRQDYKDCHTGTIDNSIGQIVSMPRNEVDEDKRNECSNGLHFCSREYLSSFTGARILMVKINPAHVVAIPEDYQSSKGRTCRYEVISELTEEEKLEGAYRDTRPAETATEKSWEDDFEALPEWDEDDYEYDDEDDLDEDDICDVCGDADCDEDDSDDVLTEIVDEEELEDIIVGIFYDEDGNMVAELIEDTVAEEDLVEASPFPFSNRDLDLINSAFVGIPGDEPSTVPSDVVQEIQDEVDSTETEPKIEQFDPNGNTVLVHDTLEDAAVYIGAQKSEVARVLRGDRKTVYGWGFRYALPSSELHQENGTLKGGLPHG